MSETQSEPVGAQTSHDSYYAALFINPTPQLERVWRFNLRYYWIVFFILLPAYAVADFVPSFGSQRLWLGITLASALQVLLYVIFGGNLSLIFVPFYWRACRMSPPAWWQRAIPLGLLLVVVGLGGAGVVALLHARLGDAVGVPLYVGGFALSGVGTGAFAVGGVGLMRAILREQRAARVAQGQAR